MMERKEVALQREILQTQILSSMFAKTVENELVLKGGLAFRTAVGSDRKTKDIDLGQSNEVPLERLQRVMRSSIKESLKALNFVDFKVTEPKQTDTVARWKINGKTDMGSHLQLTVEVSRRGIPPKEHLERVKYIPPEEYDQPPILVDTYSKEALAASKASAFLNPNRVAPRDLYDLHLLITSEVKPSPKLLAGLGEDEIKRCLEDLWDKIEINNYELFKNEVIPFLPKEVAEKIDYDTYEDMRIRVGEHVEMWLKEAFEECTMSP
ncbi:MAG: nucleotidyl transferase AbiEii/AbiGii toxin family protein [bacterium]